MIFGQSCPWLVTSTANKYWVWPWGETLLFPLLPPHRRSLFPQLSKQKHERENTTTWTGAYRHFIVPGSDYNTFIWWCFPAPKSELFSILWKASAIRFSVDCTKPSPFVLRCAVDNDLNNKHSQGFPKKHILERHRAVKSCAEESNCSLRDKQSRHTALWVIHPTSRTKQIMRYLSSGDYTCFRSSAGTVGGAVPLICRIKGPKVVMVWGKSKAETMICCHCKPNSWLGSSVFQTQGHKANAAAF